MADLLKNIYNPTFFNRFCISIKKIVPTFNDTVFLEQIFDDAWETRELKQRMHHITLVLKGHLPGDYKTNVDRLLQLIPELLKDGFSPDNFEFTCLPDFIETYGLQDYKTSIYAFEKITQFVTCEFAVRPFIIRYKEQMINQMLAWSKHEHHMVRRLATEGVRPRLPWAMALLFLKDNPEPILPILENLKNDPSESVRRSVANNLNDISKDNPELVIALCKRWKNQTKETDILVKHACRTLLKEGRSELMELFGYGPVEKIKIANFKILTPIVKIGEDLEFSLLLSNTSLRPLKIRLEYGLYYRKANRTLSRKVFKIGEKEYPKTSDTIIIRKQSFKKISTRKFYPGEHRLSIIINGKEFETLRFELVE